MSDTRQLLIEACEKVSKMNIETFIDTENVLDIEYRINGNGQFMGCIICVTTGGPHIELDTKDQQIKGYWTGCEPVSVHYPHWQEVDEFWQEMYECLS